MQAMSTLFILALGGAQATADTGPKYPDMPSHEVPEEVWYPDVYHKQNIDPDLHPREDKKFFDKDYPSDDRPAVVAKFSHPYPAVQDSGDYDADYVKDENDDGGEWSAQMDYDSWKNKYSKVMQGVNEDRAKEKEERLEWEAALAKEKAAEEKARKLEAEWERNQKDADLSTDVSETKRYGIRKATKEVQEETSDLEECKKQLAAARAELKRLQEEQAKAKAVRDKKAAELKEAEKAQLDAEKAEAKLEKEVDKEQKEYGEAKKDYDEEVSELKQTEKELAAAEERLRRFRSKVDDKGGVYRKEAPAKASARGSAAVSALALLVAMCSVIAN